MRIEDRAYFERRLRAERNIAATCEDNSAALAHLRMADEYQRRLEALTPERRQLLIQS
jgi:anti-sigma-K factor RskA